MATLPPHINMLEAIVLPVEQLYIWSALPFAVGAVVAFLIYTLNKARIAAHPELAKSQ